LEKQTIPKQVLGFSVEPRHLFASYQLTQTLKNIMKESNINLSYEVYDVIARYCSDRLLVVGGLNNTRVELWEEGSCKALLNLQEHRWSTSLFFDHEYNIWVACGRNDHDEGKFQQPVLQYTPNAIAKQVSPEMNSIIQMEKKFHSLPKSTKLDLFSEKKSLHVIVGTNGRDGLVPRSYIFSDYNNHFTTTIPQCNSTYLYDFSTDQLFDLQCIIPISLHRRGQPMVFVPPSTFLDNYDDEKSIVDSLTTSIELWDDDSETSEFMIPRRKGRIYAFVTVSFSMAYYDLYLNTWIIIPNSCIPQLNIHSPHLSGSYIYLNVTSDYKFLILTGGLQFGIHKFNLENHQWTTLLPNVDFAKPYPSYDRMSEYVGPSVIFNDNVLVFDPFFCHVLAVNVHDGTILHRKAGSGIYGAQYDNDQFPRDPIFDYEPRSCMSSVAF
jgi:hypothetical protein